MAATAVAAAFASRLAAGVPDVPLVEINLVNAEPQDGSVYMVLQFPVTNSEPITVGAPGENIYRDEGVARVVGNFPAGSGLTAARAWADTVCALFRGAEFDGVRCWAPAPGPEDNRNDVSAVYQQTVVIPYQFDHFG